MLHSGPFIICQLWKSVPAEIQTQLLCRFVIITSNTSSAPLVWLVFYHYSANNSGSDFTGRMWTIFWIKYPQTCAASNTRGVRQNAAGQWTLWRRRCVALHLQWVKVSRKGRSHPEHKGREGGSFPVKINKEIRIYALQLWTFLGVFFPPCNEEAGAERLSNRKFCMSIGTACDRTGVNQSKLAAMFTPGIITQKCFTSTAELRAAIACVAALKSCWRRLQAPPKRRKKKPSPHSVDI